MVTSCRGTGVVAWGPGMCQLHVAFVIGTRRSCYVCRGIRAGAQEEIRAGPISGHRNIEGVSQAASTQTFRALNVSPCQNFVLVYVS